MEYIKIKGARVHNLSNVSLEIPKNKIVAFTGVSGSGKSSLAFDTIFAEGQRRYIESLSPYARQFLGEMQRADVDEIEGLAPAIAIGQKSLSHNPRSTVGTLTEIYDYLRVLYARLGEVYCPVCGGEIKRLSLEEMVDIILKKAKDLKEDYVTVLSPVVQGRKGEYYQLLYDYLSLGFSEAKIDGQWRTLHDKIKLSRYKNHQIEIVMDKLAIEEDSRLFESVENAINYSQGLVKIVFKESQKEEQEMMLSSKWTCPKDGFAFPELEPRLFSFNSPHGACPTCSGLGKSDLFLKTICPDCRGKRLKPEALSVKINQKSIYDICRISIEEAYNFFGQYEKNLNSREKTIIENIIKEIRDRLSFLLEVGLDYLSLEREAETLSGGEAQRIRLASQIGSHLSNTIYVLDEPTIGLHERDIDRLLNTLQSLKQRSNTILVVEHDETSIKRSDHLIDLGPFAGKKGGEIIVNEPTQKALAQPQSKSKSLTLAYMRGDEQIEVPTKRRKQKKGSLNVLGAKVHNLRHINVELPLGRMVCLTGVSGSGKSSFLYDSLYKNLSAIKARMGESLEGVAKILGAEYIDKVVMISQSPIGRTPRSNPATYTGIFTPIRNFFASLEEARERAYTPSRFSFNVPGGRCEACGGAGHNLIEMHFLPPVLVTCEVCQGKRFNRETLQVKYKDKNISEILGMTVDEAAEFFKNIFPIKQKLQLLQDVGLGYIRLGQSATSLAGGEAQRIRLARELTDSLGKRTLFLLDEPTIGLHHHDIKMLLAVLERLIEEKNSVLLIEHNMQMIKCADYLIDLGPEGGDKGGRIVARGTPEEVADRKDSVTGKYLKEYL